MKNVNDFFKMCYIRFILIILIIIFHCLADVGGFVKSPITIIYSVTLPNMVLCIVIYSLFLLSILHLEWGDKYISNFVNLRIVSTSYFLHFNWNLYSLFKVPPVLILVQSKLIIWISYPRSTLEHAYVAHPDRIVFMLLNLFIFKKNYKK